MNTEKNWTETLCKIWLGISCLAAVYIICVHYHQRHTAKAATFQTIGDVTVPLKQFTETNTWKHYDPPLTNLISYTNDGLFGKGMTNFLTLDTNREVIAFPNGWSKTYFFHFTDEEWSLLTNHYRTYYTNLDAPFRFFGEKDK